MTKRNIYIILPAYNEEQSLPKLLDRINFIFFDSGLNLKVLVVNDGSTDNTLDVVNQSIEKLEVPIEIIDLQPNRGLAGAIKEGLFEGVNRCESDEDIIIVMDADNTHTPGLLMRMVRMITEGHDIVIASRYKSGARVVGLSRFRKMLSFGASILFRTLVGIEGVKDYTCGYRAYRSKILRQAFDQYKDKFIQQSGFGCMIEILLRVKKFDPIMGEVPLVLRYDYKEGESKMKIWKTTSQTLSLLKEHITTK